MGSKAEKKRTEQDLVKEVSHALLSRLSMRQIQIFMAVHESKNILAASRELSLDHSTVSKAIAEMEDTLGLQLFRRGPRGVQPLQAGDLLYRHGVRIVSQNMITARELAGLHAGEIGYIRCGVVSFLDAFMAKALARFKASYPSVVVQLTFSSFPTLQQQCELGELDFVVGRLNTDTSDVRLAIEIVCEDPTSLVVRKGHPLLLQGKQPSFADLREYPWLMPPANSPLRNKIEQRFMDEQIPMPENIIECASMFVVRSMLDEIPELITMPPRSILTQHMEGGDYQLLPIPLFEHNAPIGFLSRRETLDHAPIRALQSLMRDVLRGEPIEKKMTGEA